MDIWEHFRIRGGDPFQRGRRFAWNGMERIINRLKRAARDRDWVLIFAPPGAGKTYAMEQFIEEHGERYHIVRVLANHRRCMRMNCIHDALILDLDLAAALGEKRQIRRELRMRQMVRLLGIRSEEKPVILLLDEASHFTQDVFDDLKFLRDQLWSGRTDKGDRRSHLAVAMFGWLSLAKRLRANRQNAIRVRTTEAPCMSRADVDGFLRHLGLGRVVPEAARKSLFEIARYPGEIRHILIEAMEHAAVRQRSTVTPADMGPDLEALRRDLTRLGITYEMVANEAGVSKATAALVLCGKYTGRNITRGRVIMTAMRLATDAAEADLARRPTRRLTRQLSA